MGMPTTHALILKAIDESSWRLCDDSGDASDPANLVAYVERVDDGRYEVVWVQYPIGAQEFESVEQILEAGILRLADAQIMSRPIPIPHRRPLSHR